jgi:hypothetical protein
MIRPLQDIPFFLNELAYFAQLLRGKTGIEQNPERFNKRNFRFAVLTSDMNVRGL